MISFKQVYYESIKLKPYTKTVYDDITDTVKVLHGKQFEIKLLDGASAFGTIFNNVASIVDIRAPKDDSNMTIRGTKVYYRVIELLRSINIKTININLQSQDSRAALQKLLKSGELKNPRNKRGISVDEYYTTFDI